MSQALLNYIKDLSANNRIRFKKHALIRIVERNINISEIEEVLKECKIVMEYPEDRPLMSFLVSGITSQNRPLHLVIAVDKKEEYIWIITVYEPDKGKWDKTFTRRT